jgi:hypothetical protein
VSATQSRDRLTLDTKERREKDPCDHRDISGEEEV